MVNTIFLLKLKRPDSYNPALEIVRGFVIVTESEGHARVLASNNAGDEGPSAWHYGRGRCTVEQLGFAKKTAKTGILLRDQLTH